MVPPDTGRDVLTVASNTSSPAPGPAEPRPPREPDEAQREAERLRQAIPRAFIIGSVVFPLFLVFELPALLSDYPDVPWTWPVAWRLFGTLAFLIGALIIEKKALALGPLLALSTAILTLTAMSAACISGRLGGLESDISQGMSLYFIGISTLVPSHFRHAMALMLPTWIAYFALLMLIAAHDHELVIGRSFVYVALIQLGSCLFAGIGSHFLWASRQQLYRARRLGRYRLESLIARAASSEIWRAHEQAKGQPPREVALKILHAGRAFDRALQHRFEREARAASALTSEHTIRIYDYGASDDGLAFLAMEALHGVDLESHVNTWGPVAPRRAIHFARQISLSLLEAHRRGMVHGDLKPANLFIDDRRGSEDHLKVLDWGIARDFVWRDHDVTHEGLSFGTPSVMAPEAFTGERSTRTDVYAFGASLYWMLTGRYPITFEPGEGPWTAHQRQQVMAPSIVRNQLFPAGLDLLVLRCLAKDPRERPADMTTILSALTELPGEPWSSKDAADAWGSLRTRASQEADRAGRAPLRPGPVLAMPEPGARRAR